MTPTFSYDKPLPPDDRFGVLSCLKTKRRHARLFATATTQEREEAKAFSAFALERLGWTQSKVPSPDKFLSEDHLEKYRLIVRGAADYTEQVVASARVDDPYSLDLYAGITGLVGNETLETNADQADPLTWTCLEEHDCECHRTLPDYFKGHHRDADCIDLSSSPTSEEDDAVEEPIAPIAPVDKGKGVDRTQASSRDEPSEEAHSGELEETDALLYYEALLASKYDESNKRREPCQAGPSHLLLQADSSCRKSVQKKKVTMRVAARTSSPKTSITTAAGTSRRYACQWSRYFGGDCRDTFTVAQSVDRHLVTHIPDEEGYQIVLHRCKVEGCRTGCTRTSSLMRHIRQEHGETDDARDLVEELESPWYWPVELFVSDVMRSKSKATPPSRTGGSWDEKIREILTRHGITTAKPRQTKATRENDVQTPAPSSSRPPKRRRIG